MQTLTPSALGQHLQSQSTRQVIQPLTTAMRIVALGDSLIYGYGDYEGGGWVERLRRVWMAPNAPHHALYNLGVRGDGVQQVLQRLETEIRHRGELRNRLPDRIILSVGVNDSARLGRPDGRNMTDFAVFQAHIEQLLIEAQQLCPVCFVGMLPTNPAAMPFLDCLYYNHADQYRYKEAIAQACQRHSVPYLDLFDLWLSRGESWWQTRLGPDGLHPNVQGYTTIWQTVLRWAPIAQLNQALLNPDAR
ncbi:MAG: GDSL-type esterase/lipase family protein [Cyanobacteria bacterium P01_H01_bin.121]